MVLDNRLRREMTALRDADKAHMTVEEQPDFSKEAPGSVARYHIAPQDEAAWVAAWTFTKDEHGQYYGVPCRLPKGQLFAAGPQQEALMDLRYPDGHPCFTLEPPEYVQPLPTIQCFVRSPMTGRCRKKFFYRSQIVPHVLAVHTAEAAQYTEILDQIRKQVMSEDTYLADFVESLKTAQEGVVAVRVEDRTAVEEAEQIIETAQTVDVLAPTYLSCDRCSYTTQGKTKHAFAMAGHVRAKHKEA